MIPLALSIVGPTASGKSGLALALAREDPRCVIFNADSQQVYTGLEIGTGSPRAEERVLCPHHLYNYWPPDRPYDLGQYLSDVERTLTTLAPGAIPVFVGGTGFYHRGLWQGLPDLPKDAKLRAALFEEWESRGGEALYRELLERDPEAAQKIAPQNRVRVLRALEVIRLTGRPFSAFKGAARPISPLDGTVWHRWGLSLDRKALYSAIDKRVEAMFEAGWVEEVRALKDRWGRAWALTRSLGYREILDYLDGKQDLLASKALIQQATRHYAKRQLTWFRGEGRGVLWKEFAAWRATPPLFPR